MTYDKHQFRQMGFIKPEMIEGKSVYMIGAGGVGSPTALILSKMGFEDIHVFDHDIVEDQNVGSQLYWTTQDQQKKVEALKSFVETFTAYPEKFPKEGLKLNPLSIVISAVDSMEMRKQIWDYLKEQPMISLYIDARMGLESIRIYGIDMNNDKEIDLYEQNLYPDSEADITPCSARAVAYNGFFAASVIGGIVSAYLRGVEKPVEVIGDMEKFGLAITL